MSPLKSKAHVMDTSILQSIGSTWSTDRVREFISACYDRRMLMTVVLNHASNWMLGRLICEVSDTHIQPRLARGWVSLGSEEETARELVSRDVYIGSRARMGRLFEGRDHLRGPTHRLGLASLFEETSLLPPNELLVIPVTISGHLAALLLGEPRRFRLGHRDTRPEDDLDVLIDLVDQAACQLRDILRHMKKDRLPPENERIPWHMLGSDAAIKLRDEVLVTPNTSQNILAEESTGDFAALNMGPTSGSFERSSDVAITRVGDFIKKS
jgi:hypothetical protein